jgi:hypothetical protein
MLLYYTVHILQAAKKLKELGNMAPAPTPAAVPIVPTVPDTLLEQLPMLLAVGVAVTVLSRLYNKRPPFPTVTLTDPFPWCFMAAGCVMVANAIYRNTVVEAHGSADDFAALGAIAVAAGAFARWGVQLQA